MEMTSNTPQRLRLSPWYVGQKLYMTHIMQFTASVDPRQNLAPDFSICPHVFHCMPGWHWDLPNPPQTQFYSCYQWPNSYRIAHTRVGRHTTHTLTGLMVLLNELVINRFYCYDYAIKDTRKWTVFSLDGHGYIRDMDTLSLILD